MSILELSGLFHGRSEWPRSIHLPNLKELRVNVGLWMSYKIAAPKLERFGVLLFHALDPPPRENIIRAVDYARTSFPALLRLQFHGIGDSYEEEPFDYDLRRLDIRSWKEAGLEVDLLLSKPR